MGEVTGSRARVADLRWLTTREGDERLVRVAGSLADGADTLRIGTGLREEGLAATRANAVVDAARARLRARERWPDADRLLFTGRALEQASDPAVGEWRARRYRGAARIVDLCAGAGGDTMALAARARTLAVDRSLGRLTLLRHNVRARGVDAAAVAGDALAPPLRLTGELVHVDPSRRADGRRLRRLAELRPSVPALLATLGAAPAGIAIVVSPAVGWEDPALPEAAEVEFIQADGDLTEAVLWLGDLRRDAAATATLLPSGASRSRSGPRPRLPVEPIGGWLVEIAPAAVRARLHDELGAELGAWRVARRRALLSTDVRPPASPWWTPWLVEAVLPPRPRQVTRWLATAPQLPLEITTHGLDVEPEEWWRALGSPPRGPQGRRLHLIRTDDGAAAVPTRSPGGDARPDGGGG